MPGEHIGQRLALEGIEVAPRAAVADPVHRGLVRAAPVVHDGGPVGLQAGPAAVVSAMPIRLDRQSTSVPNTSNSRTRTGSTAVSMPIRGGDTVQRDAEQVAVGGQHRRVATQLLLGAGRRRWS